MNQFNHPMQLTNSVHNLPGDLRHIVIKFQKALNSKEGNSLTPLMHTRYGMLANQLIHDPNHLRTMIELNNCRELTPLQYFEHVYPNEGKMMLNEPNAAYLRQSMGRLFGILFISVMGFQKDFQPRRKSSFFVRPEQSKHREVFVQ